MGDIIGGELSDEELEKYANMTIEDFEREIGEEHLDELLKDGKKLYDMTMK